jgi:hypothetical protein
MEEERQQVDGFVRLFGLEDREARAAYHLRIAEHLFEEISEEAHRTSGYPSVPGIRSWMHDEMDFGEHFHALRNQLARRVLQRDYPEGWGRQPGPRAGTMD